MHPKSTLSCPASLSTLLTPTSFSHQLLAESWLEAEVQTSHCSHRGYGVPHTQPGQQGGAWDVTLTTGTLSWPSSGRVTQPELNKAVLTPPAQLRPITLGL